MFLSSIGGETAFRLLPALTKFEISTVNHAFFFSRFCLEIVLGILIGVSQISNVGIVNMNHHHHSAFMFLSSVGGETSNCIRLAGTDSYNNCCFQSSKFRQFIMPSFSAVFAWRSSSETVLEFQTVHSCLIGWLKLYTSRHLMFSKFEVSPDCQLSCLRCQPSLLACESTNTITYPHSG